MRSFLAGLAIFLLASSGAMAQVTGFVESVGIGNLIRPDCWNPVRVNLKSTISEPATYQLQLWQEDLDKDRCVYTREITLSPKLQEKFDLYFIPQRSLGEEAQITPGELQKAIKVKVCLPPGEGKKPDDATPITKDWLPVTFSVDNIDPVRSGFDWKKPGNRMVLVVTDGSSSPSFMGYQKAAGLAEFASFIPMHPSDLGENPLFYDAVDTVIWLSGNADDLDVSGAHRRAALEQYIRQGGRLVVCQPTDRHKIEALGSLLPVEVKDAAGNWQITLSEKAHFVDEKKSDPNAPEVDALPFLSQQDPTRNWTKTTWHTINADGKHPIIIARAKPLANAVVEVWQPWSKTDKSPYLVRAPHGLGAVTWVAQDLGDINLSVEASYWPHVWDHVIGWHNDTYTQSDASSPTSFDREKGARENKDGVVDLSKWMLQGTDYASKGAAYVVLAGFFFVIYWLAAGPGTYLFLSRKKRKDLNWFIFGAWAFVGTALTVLLVRLVLRGDAEVRHLTVVRQTIGESAYVYSRVGLYIPRDGDQTVAFDNTTKDRIGYITPMAIHPQYFDVTEFPASQVYAIPVHDDAQPVSLRIPFRSTMKKLDMRWVGDLEGSIGGSAKLVPANINKTQTGYITGTLTNQTGTDLKNVYFAFNYVERGQRSRNRVMFVPVWRNGKVLDLNAEYSGARNLNAGIGDSTPTTATPIEGHTVIAPIDGPVGWETYWTSRWPGNGLGSNMAGGADARGQTDFEAAVPKAFPIMSLFDLITPSKDESNPGNRIDFVRRGGTILNMSSAVSAGRLVILAQSASDDKPIPFPLSVEGSRVGGQGRVLYQFDMAVDRAEMEKDAANNE